MSDINVIEPTQSFTGSLAANTSIVGPFIDVQNFTSITTTASSNTPPAAANAISYEWSPDGINFDSVMNFGSDASTFITVHSSVREAFFRVRYTAGPIGIALYRLQTLLRTGPFNASVSRIGIVTGNPDALNTNAVCMGKATTTFQAVKAFPDPQTATDFYLSVGPPATATATAQIRTTANLASVQINVGAVASSRRSTYIFNDTVRGNLYISPVSPVTLSNWHYKIPPYHTFLLPMAWPTYRGAGANIFGIWDFADGFCQVSELV